jgi:hypothetical protein
MADEEKKPNKPTQQELPAKFAAPKEIPIDPQCEGVLKKIAEDMKNLQPTPKLGSRVGWISRVARTDPRPGIPAEVEYRPADVYRRLSPGRVDLLVIDAAPFPMNGAQWIRHPTHLKTAGNAIGSGGAWFYLNVLDDATFEPPASEFAVHKAALDERKKRALDDNRKRHEERIQREALASQYRAQQMAQAVNV